LKPSFGTDILTPSQNTPLHLICGSERGWNSDVQMIELFKEVSSFDPSIPNDRGETALDLARKEHHEKLIPLLE